MAELLAARASLRPEERLLLLCARTHLDPRTVEAARVLGQGAINWDTLLDLAHHHGVLLLFHHGLRQVGLTSIPPESMAALEAGALALFGHNLYLTGRLAELLRLFTAEDIPAIPYKGPELAQRAYGCVSLRQFSDLDLLISAHDVARARTLLARCGYALPQWAERLCADPSREAAFLRSHNVLPLEGPAGDVNLELHWAFSPRWGAFPLSYAEVTRRLIPVRIGGQAANSLSDEDLLLALCAHGSKHMWGRLGWICDIAELLRARPGLDWARVTVRATTLRCRRRLHLGLALAMGLLDAELPPLLAQAVRADRAAARLSANVLSWLFTPGHDVPVDWPFAQAFQLATFEGVPERLHYLAEWLFTPLAADWNLVRLPDRLWFLYRLVRPIHVTVRTGRGIARGLRARGPGSLARRRIAVAPTNLHHSVGAISGAPTGPDSSSPPLPPVAEAASNDHSLPLS